MLVDLEVDLRFLVWALVLQHLFDVIHWITFIQLSIVVIWLIRAIIFSYTISRRGKLANPVLTLPVDFGGWLWQAALRAWEIGELLIRHLPEFIDHDTRRGHLRLQLLLFNADCLPLYSCIMLSTDELVQKFAIFLAPWYETISVHVEILFLFLLRSLNLRDFQLNRGLLIRCLLFHYLDESFDFSAARLSRILGLLVPGRDIGGCWGFIDHGMVTVLLWHVWVGMLARELSHSLISFDSIVCSGVLVLLSLVETGPPNGLSGHQICNKIT